MIRDAGLDAVIGMHSVVHRLRTTVVNPWVSARRGEAGVNPPHRVLVYGAPGSGVRFIAHRLSDELAEVVGVDSIVLDSFDAEASLDAVSMKAAISGPETSGLVVITVSRSPWALAGELFASGGFERMAFVAPPDWEARRFRLWEMPVGSRVDSAGLDKLVIATEGWAGEDLESIGMEGGGGPMSTDEVDRLVRLISQAVPSSQRWLENVRALIPMMDSYGRVDDLVGYLQRYRLL